MKTTRSPFRLPAFAQAVYFLATGVWPLVHMPSFLAVTGPKDDIWLVETVGVLVAAIGIGLAISSARGRVATEMAVMAVTSSIALLVIETIYVARGRIDAIYLLDAAIEGALLAGWGVAFWKEHRRRGGA
jgi:hypothetical protein